jgi:hypothetical protein
VIVTVSVLQEDIDAGTPGEGCLCPIALAVHRALPHLPGAYVYSYGVAEAFDSGLDGDRDPKAAVFAGLPPAARQFIFRFDCSDGEPFSFEPFSFELDVPDYLMAVSS